MAKTRIQKVVAEAGIASRRAAEQMIIEGRIDVNGKLVTELPCFVTEEDRIRVDGMRLKRTSSKKVYYLLNKPKGVVCTQSDPQGRRMAGDLIDSGDERVYCVGRLDVDTTGLIILTNDGEFTQLMTHPRHGVEKTYVAEIAGALSGEDIDRLKSGVYVAGRRTRGAKIKVLHRAPTRSLLEIRISEGRNRQIRRMLTALRCKVRKLKRVAIEGITDRGIKIGRYRILKSGEVRRLRNAGLRDAKDVEDAREARAAKAEKAKAAKAKVAERAKPKAAARAKPKGAKRAKPKAAARARPKAAKRAKSKVAKRAKPKAAKRAKPKAAKRTRSKAAGRTKGKVTRGKGAKRSKSPGMKGKGTRRTKGKRVK
jgi:23S rRNA pseudouridine2605 synthase